MLPFWGRISIGYIPNGKVLGLSKFHRLVGILAAKPNIQEKLTDEIAKQIYAGLNCKAVLVKVEAEHMCIALRGIKKENSVTITRSEYGEIDEINREYILNAFD